MFQPLLLEMANTDEGREFFQIPAEYGEIERFYKNALHWRTGAFLIDDDGILKEEWKADFRIGAKWGNLIRYKWTEFCALAKTFYETQYRGKKTYRPLLNIEGKLVAAHATSTFYPDAHTESTSVDGISYTYNQTSNWDTAHDYSSGNYADDSSATTNIGYWRSNVGSNIGMVRSFFLFDTASLDDGHSITATTLSFYATATGSNSSGGGSEVTTKTQTIIQTSPSSNTAITTGDYNQCGSVDDPAEAIDSGNRFNANADWTTSQYNVITFNSTGLGFVAKAGVTKLGCRMPFDCTDDNPGGSKYNNYMTVGSADASGTSTDPKLLVTSLSPFTPKAIFF